MKPYTYPNAIHLIDDTVIIQLETEGLAWEYPKMNKLIYDIEINGELP